MSSSSGTLPFLKILLLVCNRSSGEPGTDRDLLSVQLQQRYLASGRPILEPCKATNHLPFKCLHRDQDISPPPLHEGAKIYSFWVGFLAKRSPRRRTATAVLVSRALYPCFIDPVIPKPNAAEESAIALRDRAAQVDNLATYNLLALDSLGRVPRVHHQL